MEEGAVTVSLLHSAASELRADSLEPRILNIRAHSSRRLLPRLLAVAVAAALASVLTPAATLAAVGDWAQFRESQTHQAHNTNETLISDINVHALGVAWTGATGAALDSSPAVANGVVYVGSSNGNLYAFAVGCATGGGTCTPIWTAATGGAIDSSPAAAGNRVYVGSGDGKLYAFAVGCNTGGNPCSPLWTATTGGAIHSSPSVDSSVVYVGSSDGNLYAFDGTGVTGCGGAPKVCTPLWTGATGAAIESSPAVANSVVYVGSNDHKLYAFAVGCNTGGNPCSPLWTATTGGAIHSSPTVLTGVVYVGSLDGTLYAFDGAGVTGCSGGPVVCTPLWIGATGSPIYSSPAVGDGRVWIGSDNGSVYAFRTGCNTGGNPCTPQWTGATGGTVRSSPASAHDVLYLGSSDGKIYAFDADCGTGGAVCPAAWSSSIGSSVLSSPAISDGVVYVGSSDGKLYAFHLVPDHLVLSPASTSIVRGATQAYTAEGFDSLNVDLGDLTSVTTFSITGSGTCSANQCGSTSSGSYTVTGTFGAATGTAALTVLSTGSTYIPLNPARLLDTRDGTGLAGPFSSHAPRTFQVAGNGGVPANATAVTGNLTVTAQTSNGFLFIGPVAVTDPTSSTLNFPVGDDRANGVTVALGSGGTLSVTFVAPAPGPTAHVIFDVTGYFVPGMSGATYVALSPSRILDTRSDNGLSGPFGSHEARTFVVANRGGVPANATAVTGNLTVTAQTSNGYLFIGPVATTDPTSSTLNFPVGDDRANGVTVALGGGTLSVTFVAPHPGPTAHVIFDVTGYFVPDTSGATYVALSPSRILDTRDGTGLSNPFTSHAARTFAVANRGGVPANATAVTGNLTVTAQTSLGYLFIGPVATNDPTSSTLNFPIGDDRANGVTVALGSGQLGVTFVAPAPGPTAHAIFDVTGYFVP
jgi:outer membrane protein assembly factor BamB